DIVQQNNTLIEEMLHLIIMIVGERFSPGVGHLNSATEIKREIIHQLCIKPMAHSELVKALPEDENRETGMENVIEAVASFKKPGLTGRGLYELKPECTNEFNLYFYHYSRAEQSKTEEAQRRLKRQNREDTALPPPFLPPFCPLFASLVNILQSDVLLCIMGTVLQWAVEPNGYSWSESMLQRVLHLIGMALQEEKQHLENSGEDNLITFTFTQKISKPGESPHTSPSILATLETLQSAPHLEVHKDMIKWLLKTLNAIKKLKERSSVSPVVETERSLMEESARDKDKAERKRKADIARLRREKIMAQMSEMQRHFIDENKELFQQTVEELEASSSTLHDNSSVVPDTTLIALGPQQTRVTEHRQVVICILCQEEQEFKVDNKAMVLAAFVQRSTVLSKNRSKIIENVEKYDPLFMHPDLVCGTHTGSCGHIMHAQCWQRYFDAVQAKEQRRQQRLRVHTSYDVENGEFLCPLCECISNTVIPLLPPPRTLYNRLDFSDQPGLAEWIEATSQQIKTLHILQEKNNISCDTTCLNLEEMDALPLPEGFIPDFQPKNPYSESIREMLRTFGTATYKVGLKVHPNEQDPRVSIMCWGSCAYTIQSIERILADEDKPLFGQLPCRQDDCLKSLTRFAAAHWTVSPLSVIQGHFSRLFTSLVPNERIETSPSIIDIDMFHLLVSLELAFPSMQCQDFSGTSLATGDLHLFHLVTMAQVVQILLTSSAEENGMDQENTNEEEELAVLSIYKHLYQCTGSALKEVSSGWHLCKSIKAGILPFLRCCSLFYHYLNGVPAPQELQVNGPNQFEHLCSYLCLPTNLAFLFQENSKMAALIESWCSNKEIFRYLRGERSSVSYPRESNKLIDLPEDYSCLINQASNFSCPKSGGDKSRAPTLCLVCGSMLCSQSYCCQTEVEGEDVGACTAHTYTCGSGVSVFLRG
ncbi:E3 ubiquitin-protein ligase UBR2-like, partial [Microcaecilia unicolor]|uniref:E3 ubiquitin-protein ligase n=1 Tax=Microcaecilia unicolor TaxID=1415580 RepID=A0A6P7X3V2_9AMPH